MANENITELLFLHALTSLHPGAGTALGVVDLPVQRERHTQWPTIPGSSLKGVLRSACRTDGDNDAQLTAVFGPSPEGGENKKFAGALSVTDARILAFPVRSLRGVFAWTTCPAVLERFNRDLRLTKIPPLEEKFQLENETAACVDDSPLLINGNDSKEKKLLLEEYEFTKTMAIKSTHGMLARLVSKDKEWRDRLQSHLVVLSDDDFTFFVRNATEVVARVGLDYEKKTARDRALFYQEFLPPETIFYSIALVNDSRSETTRMTAADVMGYLREKLPGVIQIGGDETTGKGLCTALLTEGSD